MDTTVVQASTSNQGLTPKNVFLNSFSGPNTNPSINTEKSTITRQEPIEREGAQSAISIDKIEVPPRFPDTKRAKSKEMRNKKA